MAVIHWDRFSISCFNITKYLERNFYSETLGRTCITHPCGLYKFFCLTILIGYLFINIYKEKPQLKEGVIFGIIFGGLYSLSNFLGSFSFIDISVFFLILTNIVYFIEIFGVVIVYNNLLYGNRFRKKIGIVILVFIVLLISGIIVQNIF